MKSKALKTIQFKTEAFNEEEGIFSGYGAVFGNVDSGGDIIEHGAFTKTLAKGWERVKILALHNDGILPIGRPIELREDENGLYLKAKISDTATGRDVKTLIKDGVLSELSIGYEPVVFEFDQNQIRHLKELELFEVSVVTWAMNEQALITDYKSLDKKAAEIKEAADRLDRSLKLAAAGLAAAAGKKKKSTAKHKNIFVPKSKKSREIVIIRR
ncbi:MAG: HK97 family phage prohead protease [Lachnospiraceae bacterium]|nr:HK97 family phage prohead protease [Lachnospiraceae bacterium]